MIIRKTWPKLLQKSGSTSLLITVCLNLETFELREILKDINNLNVDMPVGYGGTK